MKCPKCDTWSTVLETRDATRRRECANGHRFTTDEVVRPDERVHKHARDLSILADARSHAALARELGIDESRVRQIRAGARQARSTTT